MILPELRDLFELQKKMSFLCGFERSYTVCLITNNKTVQDLILLGLKMLCKSNIKSIINQMKSKRFILSNLFSQQLLQAHYGNQCLQEALCRIKVMQMDIYCRADDSYYKECTQMEAGVLINTWCAHVQPESDLFHGQGGHFEKQFLRPKNK